MCGRELSEVPKMSDLNMNFEKLNKACKEVNEKMGKMMDENNPFDTISKIAKDIRDREDKEMALAFTNVIGLLLRENGVVVKTSRYEFETDNEADKNKYIIKKEYGISIDGLDFTEHDKKFKDEIKQLKYELFDVQKSADEYYNKCIDLTNQIGKLKSELEAKVDFETDRLVKLPFDALETANMLINATYKAEIPFLEKQVDRNVYGIDDLEQIGEHLLVYCNHNKEDEV